MFINYNGNILPADLPIFTAGNRAFRYGDGLFESIRVFDGHIPFFQLHWSRLEFGSSYLKLELPHSMDGHFFKNEIEKLTGGAGNWRLRLSVWRSDGGFYTPASNRTEFLIEASPLSNSFFELNKKGLALVFFEKMRLPNHPEPLTFKSSNALTQVMASIFKSEKGVDDCLVFNSENRIACSSNANIFLVKNGEIITPEVQEGCVAGTMRSLVISQTLLNGIKIITGKIQRSDLSSADEIFLTNSIQGIRWVEKVVGIDKSFQYETSQKLLAIINQIILEDKLGN